MTTLSEFCKILKDFKEIFLFMWNIWRDDIHNLITYYNSDKKPQRLLGIFKEHPSPITEHIDLEWIEHSMKYHFLEDDNMNEIQNQLYSIIIGWI